MLSASTTTLVGSISHASPVTAAAAASQAAAATAAAVGSISVNNRSPPNGSSASSWSAAATCTGDASARVNRMACRACSERSPHSAASTAWSSDATSAATASARPSFAIRCSARPTRCAHSSTGLYETSMPPPFGRFGCRSASPTPENAARCCSRLQPSVLTSTSSPAALAGCV
jgi:hypothetical protein